MEVCINGVKYVPVQEVLVNVNFFIDKLIETWATPGYDREEMMNYLRIHVSDSFSKDDGIPTIKEFIDGMIKEK